MNPKKMLLIFNPISGKGEFAAQLYEVVDRFTRAGYEVTVRPTQAPRDAYDLVLRRAGEFDCLCVSGGDGTLNEIINALMPLAEKPMLGYIPSGSTNDFATSLRIPRDAAAAADIVTSGTAFTIDIGRFGDRFFAYVAAFGLFTAVTYGTPQDFKNVLGRAAYILEGVKRLGAIQAQSCEITVDGETFSGDFIFGMASNSVSVGGFRAIAMSPVQLDDGLFEVLLVKRPRSFMDLQNIISSLLNHEVYTESLIFRRAARMRVISDSPLSWTLDGEFGGATTDVEIQNDRRALEIMAPAPETPIA